MDSVTCAHLQQHGTETALKMTSFQPQSDLLSVLSSELAALAPVWWYVWVGPAPGLEVAPECFQVHGREVGSDAFSQPPLPLRCAGTARLAELVPEMFPSNPPEKEGRHRKECSHMEQGHFKSQLLVSKTPKIQPAAQHWYDSCAYKLKFT